MQYQVIRESDTATLVRWVNIFLTNGWEVSGGPFTFNGQVCQAMIKRS